jgi:hypothetical protein
MEKGRPIAVASLVSGYVSNHTRYVRLRHRRCVHRRAHLRYEPNLSRGRMRRCHRRSNQAERRSRESAREPRLAIPLAKRRGKRCGPSERTYR